MRALSLLPSSFCWSGIDEAQVDRRVAAVGDDRQQDIVARLRRPVPLLDRLDAFVEQALIGLEGGARLGRDDLAFAAGDRRHLDEMPADPSGSTTSAKERNMAISSGTLTNSREARDRPVFAGGLKLELGRGVAEGRGPGVEFVQAALRQRSVIHQSLHGEHFAERVGDRRARGEDQRAARDSSYRGSGTSHRGPRRAASRSGRRRAGWSCWWRRTSFLNSCASSTMIWSMPISAIVNKSSLREASDSRRS